MRILVTGGAGYLGSTLVPQLLGRGYDVTVVDSVRHGVMSLIGIAGARNFEFVRGDVRDDSVMRDLYRDADVIIPLAAIVGAPACDRSPADAQTTNFDSIGRMIKLLSPEQRVIYPTTNSGYGRTSGDVVCTEESPLMPVSLYGRTKVDAERIILERGNAVTLRLATVFGVSPRLRLDLLVNSFVFEAQTRGYITIYERHAKRNYIHVADVADCFVHVIENFEEMKDETFNCGLDEANFSKAELADLVRTFFPRFAVNYCEYYQDPDQRNYVVSNQKLRKAGFTATRSIADAIPALSRAIAMLPPFAYSNATY